MIRSDLIPGLVYGEVSDGDARSDVAARERLSSALGITGAWATISQVHGATGPRMHSVGSQHRGGDCRALGVGHPPTTQFSF